MWYQSLFDGIPQEPSKKSGRGLYREILVLPLGGIFWAEIYPIFQVESNNIFITEWKGLLMIGLTGHCPVIYHIKKMELIEQPNFYQPEQIPFDSDQMRRELAENFLCKCEVFA